jgi:hypothetical protein
VTPMAIGWTVFAVVFGSALLAMFVHSALPEHHVRMPFSTLCVATTGSGPCQLHRKAAVQAQPFEERPFAGEVSLPARFSHCCRNCLEPTGEVI